MNGMRRAAGRMFYAIVTIALLFTTENTFAAVGRTPGAFTVSPTGAAQYSIPVWTPPGAGGMRPGLALTYSHNRDNGLLGMGFDVSGFSSITRCPKTIAQDGVDGPIQMLISDGYCLDGNRLRLDSGTYGQSNSVYRTELESYAKVIARDSVSSGPGWFEVWLKNGLIYEYGHSTTSRIDFGASTAKEWALTSIRDRAGNTIEFKYTEDSSFGSYRPDEINYATNIGASLTTAPYQVKFQYESAARPDPIYGYWPAGGALDEIKRLEKIEIRYSGSIKKMYRFAYGSGAGSRSRLTSVEECSTTTSDCLSPTQLTWTTATAGLQSEQDPSLSAATPIHWIDVDGDGRDDMVYTSHFTSGSGTWRIRKGNSAGGFDSEINTTISNTNYSSALPLEWNGDGLMDLLVPYASNRWYVLVSSGSTFSAPWDTGITATGAGSFARAMDLNGDGKDDLVRMSSSGAATLYVRYQSGSNFGSEVTLWSTFDANFSFAVPFAPVTSGYRSRVRRADFNLDGRQDFICWLQQFDPESGSTTLHVARCYWNGYEGFDASTDGSSDLGGSHTFGDFNDDGMTDIVWVKITGGFRLLYGGSSGYVNGPSSSGLYTSSFVVTDFDGDARDDVLAQSTGSPFALQYLRSTGSNLASMSSTGYNYPAGSAFWVGDFNGDAFTDVFGSTKYRLHEPTFADLLVSATDGFGVAATFTYTPMTDATVYAKGSGATYPQSDVKYARPIVKQVTATDGSGSGSTFNLNFTYEAARVDLAGRGYLGFAKRTVVDTRFGLNIKTEENYRQTWPHTGLISSAALKQSSGNILRETTNSSHELSYGTGFAVRKFPYVYNSQTVHKELNNTHYRTVTATLPGTNGVNGIDSTWGAVKDVTTTTLEVATGVWTSESKSEQITHTLYTDTTNWCVGRPDQTQVITDLSISGISTQTRTLDRTWDGLNCRVTQDTIEPGNTDWQVAIAYTFDSFGNVSTQSITGAGGMTARTTTTTWGSAGQFPVTITTPLGHVTSFDYNYGLGLLSSVTDPNSESGTLVVTGWTHDAFGRKDVETLPDNTDSRWVFGTCPASDSRVKYTFEVESRKTTDAVIRTDKLCFDRFDRLLYRHSQLPDGSGGYSYAVTTADFDARGRVSKRYNPYTSGGAGSGYWSFTYDALDRVTAEQLYTAGGSLDRQQTHAYSGLSTTTTDFRSQNSTRVLTAWGDLARATDPASNSTNYAFDAFSQLIKVTDPLSNIVSQISYNIRGMKTASSDLDMGSWTYLPNALGEVRKIRDAKTSSPSWTTEYSYDALGRTTQRVEAEGTTDWTWGNSAANNNIGALGSVSGPGYSESLTYDTTTRLTNRQISITGDTSYDITYGYESQTGLLDTLTYPVSTSSYRFKLQYEYSYGTLSKVKRFDSPFTAYWTLNGLDARGNVLLETLGNGIQTSSAYDPLTGLLASRDSGSGALQDLEYTWDPNGNLDTRKDLRQGLTEDFAYDSLDRVTGSTLTGVGTNLSVGYDALGNLTSKTGAGSFDYTTAQSGCSYYSHSQPHAVRNAGGTIYCYDANGNAVKKGSATITWTSYNLPSSISSGTPSSQFSYGPDRQRFKQVGNYTGGTETTYTIGGVLEKVIGVSVTYYKHYIASPSGPVATYTRRSNATEDTFYFTKDHLGSVDTVTNASASVQVRLSYDAFGLRRNESGWAGTVPSGDMTTIASTSRHGYTTHEHLDNLALIHMNGRVQDPLLGRFLSADPYVPNPTLGQSFNRYSYVRNNPLSWTDPSGFVEEDINVRIQDLVGVAGGGGAGESGGGSYSGLTLADVFAVTGSFILNGASDTAENYQPQFNADGEALPQPTPDSRDMSSVPCDSKPCGLEITVGGILTLSTTDELTTINSPFLSAALRWANAKWARAADRIGDAGESVEQSAIDLDYATLGIISEPLALAGTAGAALNHNNLDNTILWATIITPVRGLGGIRAAEAVGAARTLKAVNLPAWRKVGVDMAHVLESHTTDGALSVGRTTFPELMNAKGIERAIREAYRYGEKIGSQGDRVLMQGTSGGLTIQMWVNRATRTIETAYPVIR